MANFLPAWSCNDQIFVRSRILNSTSGRAAIRLLGIVVLAVAAMGCTTLHPHHAASRVVAPNVPRELSKVALPTYSIEPPDILVIEAIHIVPKSPYLLRTADIVAINVQGALPDAPVKGAFPVQPGGLVNLGPPYGTAKVTGMTVEQAQEEVRRVMALQVREPFVSVSLVEMAGKQQIAGQHLVGPDGTVTLGSYGSVAVVGLTLAQAKQVIERHLTDFLENPEVAVDVFAYNSKVYYVITEGAGLGDGVTKFPITGNDTVLDALANINGTTQVSSKRIWIARPVPYSHDVQILPVDWKGISAQAIAATNYQILPGDRIFVAEDHMVALDTKLGKLFAPWERVMGFSLLSVQTVSRFSGHVLQGGGLRGFFAGSAGR